jgi:hypothetical protein
MAGYKIYGSPTLYSNQPLEKPRKVAGINEAGQVILADGSRFHIYGIKTILSDPLNETRYFQLQLPTLEAEVAAPNKPVSKVCCKTRNMYWCGNVWFPKFFPGRLPRFGTADLGKMLVSCGAAVPTVEVLQQDPVYAKELMLALESPVRGLKLGEDKDCALTLGGFLIRERAEFFNTGAWLLAHGGDPEIAGTVRKRIFDNLLEAEGRGRVTISRERVQDLVPILIKVSPQDAKEVVHKIIDGHRNKFPYMKVAVALKLLVLDDWYGLDSLMNQIYDSDLETSYRQGIVGRLENPLSLCWGRGGGDYKESSEHYWARLAQWYRDNRDNLIWNDERRQMTFRTDSDSGQ